jgi:hypothetical protein
MKQQVECSSVHCPELTIVEVFHECSFRKFICVAVDVRIEDAILVIQDSYTAGISKTDAQGT